MLKAARITRLAYIYAPHDLAKVNNSEIERVTEMDKKNEIRPSGFYLLGCPDSAIWVSPN